MKLAYAYIRTSSATNVGPDKDSHKRQLEAIEGYAATAAFKVVLPPFYDAAVSGTDPIHDRPGFSSLLLSIDENPDVKTILLETASRFARDLIVQETGYQLLRDRGIDLIAVDSPDGFLDDTPTAELVRQILGAVAQFEKSMTVSKLRVARERKRRELGKCEGRKRYQEINPEVVDLAKKLYRKPRNGKRQSLRKVAKSMAEQGFLNGQGNSYGPSQIKAMVS
jgi:DNA invertase Pin-like site-specific DNA recombinase